MATAALSVPTSSRPTQAVTAASEGGGDPAAAEAALTTAEESAPDDLADPVGTMVAEANSLLSGPPPAEDGPPVIPSDDFFTASVEVGDWMAENCDYADLPVTAQNYEFEGIPEEVPAGETLIRLTNEGTEYHEVALMKIADGEERSLEELLALPEEEVEAVVTDVGFVFAPPSLGSWTKVDLEPGPVRRDLLHPRRHDARRVAERRTAGGRHACALHGGHGHRVHGRLARPSTARRNGPRPGGGRCA